MNDDFWRITGQAPGFRLIMERPQKNDNGVIKLRPSVNLVTPEELVKLPDGTRLISIMGEEVVKGIDYIDDEIRWGYLAYGVPQ